jgi:hypothetical protein
VLFPMLTTKVMEKMHQREKQFERFINRPLSLNERDAFAEAYKASRMDVFSEMNVKADTTPENTVAVQGFIASEHIPPSNSPAQLRINLNRE